MRLLAAWPLQCTWGAGYPEPRCPNAAMWWGKYEGQPVLWCKYHHREMSGDLAALGEWLEKQGPPGAAPS
jgi:hypothetical protein